MIRRRNESITAQHQLAVRITQLLHLQSPSHQSVWLLCLVYVLSVGCVLMSIPHYGGRACEKKYFMFCRSVCSLPVVTTTQVSVLCSCCVHPPTIEAELVSVLFYVLSVGVLSVPVVTTTQVSVCSVLRSVCRVCSLFLISHHNNLLSTLSAR